MKAKTVTWGNYTYPSQRELARYLKRDESTLRAWLKRGFTGAEKGAWLWEGKLYKSASEIVSAYPTENRTASWFRSQMKRGIHSFNG